MVGMVVAHVICTFFSSLSVSHALARAAQNRCAKIEIYVYATLHMPVGQVRNAVNVSGVCACLQSKADWLAGRRQSKTGRLQTQSNCPSPR